MSIVKRVEHELKTEERELMSAAIKLPATNPLTPEGNNSRTSVGKTWSEEP